MNVAHIDPDRCDRAPGCPAARVCPTGAIFRPSPFGPWRVESSACSGCGACVRVCPTGAVSMRAREES
ncbi:MAG TPA: 4Fe-4S binding protein [Coriobacteriia bacterium]